MKRSIATIAMVLIAGLARAAEPAVITERGKTWTLRNETLQATVSFSAGNLSLTSFSNREAKTDYLKGRSPAPLFCFVIDGKVVASMQREAVKGEFRANLHQGGKASIIKITAERFI